MDGINGGWTGGWMSQDFTIKKIEPRASARRSHGRSKERNHK